MLSEQAKEKLEDAIATVSAEGYTFCGFAVKQDDDGGAEIQPFTNHPTIPEFVYNLLSGAGMIAQGVWDTSKIEAAMNDLQSQSIKIHEA